MALQKFDFLVHVQGKRGLCSAVSCQGLMTEVLTPYGCTIWNTGLLHHSAGEVRGTGIIKGFGPEVKSLPFQLIVQNESHDPAQLHGEQSCITSGTLRARGGRALEVPPREDYHFHAWILVLVPGPAILSLSFVPKLTQLHLLYQ